MVSKRSPRAIPLAKATAERARLAAAQAGMLALPSRCAERLPHLTAHDVAEIDAEERAVLTEIGNN